MKSLRACDEAVEQSTRRRSGHASKPRSKPRWKRAKRILRGDGVVVVRLEQVHRQRRHQGSGEDVGGEHGEDDGFGERHEEVARDAGEEEHRQEDDADAERGDERGDGDLRGAFKDGVRGARGLLRDSARCFRW